MWHDIVPVMTTNRTEAADHPRTTPTAAWMVRLAATLVGVGAAVMIAFGVSLVLEDMATRGEWFDGFGTFFGLVICGLGAVLAAAALLAAWLVGRHPFAAAMVVCALGVLIAVAGGVTMTSLGELVSASVVLGGVLVGGLGFGAALEARRVAITSPGGNTR